MIFLSELQEQGVISSFKAARFRAKYAEAFQKLEKERALGEKLLNDAKDASEQLEGTTNQYF